MHDAVVDAEQLDAAAVRDQVRAHLVQRAQHPLAHRHRMQPVQEQQVRDELVLDRHASHAATIRDSPSPYMSSSACTSSVDDLALRRRERLDLVQQRLDLARSSRAPRTSASAPA